MGWGGVGYDSGFCIRCLMYHVLFMSYRTEGASGADSVSYD